jgi:hypothetical protein
VLKLLLAPALKNPPPVRLAELASTLLKNQAGEAFVREIA